ncbi:MAG: hypothetical protein ACYDC1_15160 [Limisphaerales bacterium]
MKRRDERIVVMTTTNELFLPTRLIYEVYDAGKLRARLDRLSCMSWDPAKRRWTWDYEGAARKMRFPPAYDQVPEERQPVVLASCYLVNDQTFHVYTRCGFRAVKFLVFFEKEVSRSIAVGKFIDHYNLVTSVNPGAPVPFPEDFFKDESRIEFDDLIGLLDRPESPAKREALLAHEAKQAQLPLRPLERHRLDGFYHDGPALMEQMVLFRNVMAGLQHQSDQPIRPAEVIDRILRGEAGGLLKRPPV